MRPSTMLKKFIGIIAFGLSVFITIAILGFFCLMGKEFGYEDLQCQSFPETRKFAEELTNTLNSIGNSVGLIKNSKGKIDSMEITVSDIKTSKGTLIFGNAWQEVTYQDLIDSYEFYRDFDGYGIYGLEVADGGYEDSWYTVALDSEQIKDTTDFFRMTHDEYVKLVMENAQPNAVDVGGFSEEDLESVFDGDIAADNSIDIDEYTTEVEYIDESFAANSYIGFYDGMRYVYSPEEDMFYSSIYGWYAVPDELYFISDEVNNCTGIDLLLYQFASKDAILKTKIGEDYLNYATEVENAAFERRNIVYYVVTDRQVFKNVDKLDRLLHCDIYFVIEPKASGEYTVEFHNCDNVYMDDEFITGIMQNNSALKPDEKLYIGVYTTYPYSDVFSQGNQIFRKYYPYTIPALIIGIIMLVVSIIMSIVIVKNSGRDSREDKTIHLIFLDKIPVEIMFAAGILGIGLLLVKIIDVFERLMYSWNGWYSNLAGFWGVFIICFLLSMTGILSLVRRGKAKQLFDRSIFRWIFCLIKRLIQVISRQKNLIARTVELFILYWMIMLFGFGIMCLGYDVAFVIGATIIIVLNIGVLILLIWQSKGEQSIRDTTKALADGDLEYQVHNIKCLGTEKEIIENINHLSDGLQKAVEQSIYDERMKAELITNVSHDIKTPLTSIINYVDLMKRENIEDETLLHYIEVLDRKSQRLKQLTEDLVEVSKITTGNIELERVPIDFGELLRQSLGEFEDKFAEQKLQVVDNIQDHSYMIFADGRRTFRILENLFQNIYKYAMPDTRVYIDLKNEEEKIILAIKNISKAPLNIDSRELMERFVRGDQSRTTEGSGLGLSIAQDLVKLQDGEFHLCVDGDLFKVIITFPEFISKEIIDVADLEEEHTLQVQGKTTSLESQSK